MAIVTCDTVTSPAGGIAAPIELPALTADVTTSHQFTRQRLERLARRRGLQLIETRHRWSEEDGGGEDGGFGLVDWEAEVVAYGGGMPWPGATLDEVIDFLHSPEADAMVWRMSESEFDAYCQTQEL